MTFQTPSTRDIETAMKRARTERSLALVSFSKGLGAWVLATKDAWFGNHGTARGSC